ncbi:MAG: ATP-binding protein [Bacteroidia bacterium]|nr:ATP-binding protein [Bacteroidia bacterium]
MIVERRWLYVTLITALLLFVTLAVRGFFLHHITTHWDERKTAVDSTEAAVIGQRLDDAARSLLQLADAGAKAAATLANGMEHHGIGIVEHLHGSTEQRISFELRDSQGVLLRYSGHALPPFEQPQDGGLSLIDATPFAMLVHERALHDASGSLIGSLRLGLPFRVTVPVNRRFLNAEGLVETLAQEFELDLRPEPLPLTRRPSERVYVAFSPGGRTLAVLSFEGAISSVYTAEVAAWFNRTAVFLLLVLLLTISVPLFRLELRIPWAPLSMLAATIHCWGLRYVLQVADAPALLLPSIALDPSAFASSFGFGIAASAGDVLFSAFALLANTTFFYVRSLRDNERPIGILASFAWFIAVAASFPVVLRAAAAVLRSFVIDSSFNFDDVGALFDDPLHVLMICHAWLLTLSWAFLFLAMSLWMRRALRPLTGAIRHIFLIVPLATSIVVFLLVSGDMIFPWWVFVFCAVVFLLFGYIPLTQRRVLLSSLSAPFILAAMFGSMLTVVAFRDAMEAKRSAEIEAIASDLSRPVDAWSHVLLEQTLQEIGHIHVQRTTFGDVRPAYETAFRVWSASPLSRLQNNSALLLIDSSGQPVSRFAVGNDPFLLSMHTLSTTIEKTEGIVQSAYRRFDDREKRYYKGYTDVPSDSGRFQAVVVLEALDPMQISHNAVDLLRNTTSARSLAPEDHFVVSRFSANRLVQTTDPLMRRGMPLPREIAENLTLHQQGQWGVLQSGSTLLHTFFIPLPDEDAVLSISRGSPDILLSLYRWLRIGFFFAILSFGAVTLLMLTARRSVPHTRGTFARKLQLSLLAVAAIPLLLIWIAGRGFVLDTTTRDMEQQVTENLEILRSNILQHLPDSIKRDNVPDLLTDQLCQDIRLRTGKDINVFRGATLVGTSKPELYHTGLLNNRLNPEAWEALVIGNRDLHLTREQIGEFPYNVGYRALRDSRGALSAIISTPTLFERNRAEEVYVRASAAVLLWITLMGVIVLLVSTAMSRQISRPLDEFLHATRDITAGNLARKVRVSGSAEFVDLMTAFNTMTDRLRQSKEELAAAERELAWKEMARQVAHEIRNPLTPMKLSAQHLQRAWRDKAPQIGSIIEKVTRTLIDQIDSLSRISDEFSRFGRMPRRTMGEVDISRLLEEAVGLFRTHENIHFDLNIAPALPIVLGDREELARAVTNLLRNAVQAIASEGEIRIHVSIADDLVRIVIEDDGCGIPPDLLPRIFEPNFSTKTEGMGLGLAIVKKILDDTGGSIHIQSEPGHGTRVVVDLPPAPEVPDTTSGIREAQ